MGEGEVAGGVCGAGMGQVGQRVRRMGLREFLGAGAEGLRQVRVACDR